MENFSTNLFNLSYSVLFSYQLFVSKTYLVIFSHFFQRPIRTLTFFLLILFTFSIWLYYFWFSFFNELKNSKKWGKISEKETNTFLYLADCLGRVSCNDVAETTMTSTRELDTIQDFLIKLGIKPSLHILKISTFSLNHVIARPTKIMSNLLKVCEIRTFKVIFWHQKSTESLWIFFL